MTAAWDVAVVGGGLAGLTVLASAATAGLRSLLIERQPATGGTSAIAIGSITAAGTGVQRTAGVDDDPERYLQDLVRLAAAAGSDREAIRRGHPLLHSIATGAGPAIDWAASLGARFTGPFPEHGHSRDRVHLASPDIGALLDRVREAAEAEGATMRLGRRVVSVDLHGSRWSLTVEGGDGRGRVDAGAVVLAAGDVSALIPGDGLVPINPAATGDGLTLAASAGGKLMNRDEVVQIRSDAWPQYEPNPALYASGAEVVGPDGSSLWPVDGEHPTDRKALARALRPYAPGPFHCILDSQAVALATPGDDRSHRRDGWYRTGRPYIATFPSLGYAYLTDMFRHGLTVQAPTREDLLDRIVQRSPRSAHEVGGNWVGLGPLTLLAALTVGGVDVGPDGQVRRPGGDTVPGLYAVGANAWNGPRLAGHGHHLAWALTSGRACAATLAADR